MREIDKPINTRLGAAIVDEAAWAEKVSELQPYVINRLKGDGVRHHDAEDLSQITFEKLFRAKERIPEVSNLSAYAARIARNAALDRAKFLMNSEIPTDEFEDRSVDTIHGHDERLRVEAALSSLSDEHRAVIELVYYQDLPIKDVAESLGTPPGTVKSRLNHARNNLREHLTNK